MAQNPTGSFGRVVCIDLPAGSGVERPLDGQLSGEDALTLLGIAPVDPPTIRGILGVGLPSPDMTVPVADLPFTGRDLTGNSRSITAYYTGQSNGGFLRSGGLRWLAFDHVCFNHGAIYAQSARACYFLLISIFHNQHACEYGYLTG